MIDELRVMFFTMANLNTIDGSSIWMQSVAETLHQDERLRITIPLRAPERRDVITGAMHRLERVRLLDPRQFGHPDPAGLSIASAIDVLRRVDAKDHHDVVLLRAFDVCRDVVRAGLFAGRLWSAYILEPERDTTDPEYLAAMAEIAAASRHVICQSEEMRALLESLVPAAIGKTIILAPGIPEEISGKPDPGRVVQRMIYAGKFHRFYPVDWMVEAFRQLRATHPQLEFHVAGDKFHRPRGDAEYANQLERALLTTPGLVWHGGIARDEVEALFARGGVALSLWDFRHGPGMNNLVISTKLLDFCSVGLPVILNRTAAQEGVLGIDYPLFVDRVDEALPLLQRLFEDPALYRQAAERTYAASRQFTYPEVLARIAPYLDRALEEARPAVGHPRQVVVAGSGASDVATLLGSMRSLEIVQSREPRSGDVLIVADRTGMPLSSASSPRVRRILQLEPDAIVHGDASAYDRVVAPDDAVASSAVAYGVSPDRISVIPRPLDDPQLARPKLPGAMFNVAFVGVPSPHQRARLRAFQERLLQQDERFRLVVRHRSADSTPSVSTDAGAPDDRTEDALASEPDDGDWLNWYRTVGFVVAVDPTSRQLPGILEAMASGAVPVLIDAAGTLGSVPGMPPAQLPDAAAAFIADMVHGGTRDDAAAWAVRTARSLAGLATVRAAWIRELS